jgi:hypothetical protein
MQTFSSSSHAAAQSTALNAGELTCSLHEKRLFLAQVIRADLLKCHDPEGNFNLARAQLILPEGCVQEINIDETKTTNKNGHTVVRRKIRVKLMDKLRAMKLDESLERQAQKAAPYSSASYVPSALSAPSAPSPPSASGSKSHAPSSMPHASGSMLHAPRPMHRVPMPPAPRAPEPGPNRRKNICPWDTPMPAPGMTDHPNPARPANLPQRQNIVENIDLTPIDPNYRRKPDAPSGPVGHA